MKKILFFVRLAMLLLCAALPSFHPGVVRAFDASRVWLCFVLVPAACLLAFLAPPRDKKKNVIAILALIVIFGTLIVNGWSASFAYSVGSAIALWVTTWLIFRKRCYKLLYIEPLYLVWVAWRLSSFSLSSVSMAEQSRVPFMIIAVVAITLWCAYSAAIGNLEYRDEGTRKGKKSPALLVAILCVVAIFSTVLFLVPDKVADFMQRIDAADRRIPPKRGRNDILGEPGSGKSRDAKVVESSDGNWRSKTVRSGGDGSQRMVMIVESPVDTLYLADTYRGTLDPVTGFISDPEYFANSLPHAAYLETWENPETSDDLYRREVSIDVYSAIPDKLTSWLPFRIEPTVLDNSNFPLRYHYRATSLVSECSITGTLPSVNELSSGDRESLAPYLALPLSSSELESFTDFLAANVDSSLSWAKKVDAVLKSMKVCKYEVGGEDDTTVAALSKFLFETRNGDCTEFSNTAALLGRIAGIPSRVVTGFAVTSDLQTAAHREGVRKIVEKFPPLKGKDPSRLFLVTTAHAHSWVEFYIPGAGWVDFESTQYAIPPDKGGDPNSTDILIPDFSSVGKRDARHVNIPWRLLASLAFVAFAGVVVLRWMRRTASLVALLLMARDNSERGAKARYRLFLVSLFCRGYRRKGHDETPREYAASYPELLRSAELYETSVFHPDETKRREAKASLDAETRAFLSARKGLIPLLREISGFRDGGLL